MRRTLSSTRFSSTSPSRTVGRELGAEPLRRARHLEVEAGVGGGRGAVRAVPVGHRRRRRSPTRRAASSISGRRARCSTCRCTRLYAVITAHAPASRTAASNGTSEISRSVRSSTSELIVMRSNSESLATKCFTVQPTPCDCTPVMYATASARRQERILGVALEVAARERVPVDVDGRREQHVRLLASRLDAEPLPDFVHEVGVPGRAERGAAREVRRRPPRPLLAARAARAVGHLQRAGCPSRSTPGPCHRSTPATSAAFSSRVSSCDQLLDASLAHPRGADVRLPPCPRHGTTSTARSRWSPAPAAGSAGRSAHAFAAEGMRVVAADVEAGALAETAATARASATTFVTDVSRLRRRRRARRPRVRDVRRGRRAVQQRGRVRGRLDVGAARRATSSGRSASTSGASCTGSGPSCRA